MTIPHKATNNLGVETVRYTDARDRPRVLTRVQWIYLATADWRPFEQGWGGLTSTRVVRLLRERGLIDLDDRRVPWKVTRLKKLGEEVLKRWREKQEAQEPTQPGS